MNKLSQLPDDNTIEHVWDDAIAAEARNTELKYAKSVFFGATNKELREAFSRGVISVTDDMLFMTDQLFNYYFHHFSEFVLSQEYDEEDAVIVADCYLGLLTQKLETQSISSQHPLKQTMQTLDFIDKNLSFFNTAPEIFGDFEVSVKALQHRFSEILDETRDTK